MNTVYTVAIGQRYTRTLWAKDCLRAWEQYCDRHNLNLHVQTTATFPFRERSTRLHAVLSVMLRLQGVTP